MGLKRYILVRVLLLIPIFFGVSIVAFSLIHFIPGGPIKSALGVDHLNQEVLQAMRAKHGLDDPLHVQYLNWLTDFVRGDFGQTIVGDKDIGKLIRSSIMPTFWVTVSSILVTIAIGIPAGIISAINKNTPKGGAVTIFAFAGLSIPNFWLGIILLLGFGLYLGWFPTLGYVDPMKDPVEGVRHLLLPAFTLGTAAAALVTRMMRSSMIEVISEDYIRLARAKGLPRRVILNKHAVKNALLPTVTIIGLNFGYFLGGSVIVEQIFAIPGLGRLIYNAILSREYLLVQQSIMIVALLFGLGNLFTDILYAYLDPRIKYD